MNAFYMAIILSLFTLPGCGRIIQWGKDNFYQGEQVGNFCQIPRDYLRSVVAYDQFMTQAVFDALWLSDAVRGAYVDAFVLRTGKNTEQKNMLLRRELEENNHYVTFYVLSLYTINLGDAASSWSVYLKIDDVVHHPAEIKYADLNPEYKAFFGKVFNRFKTPYQIVFDAKDVDGNLIITPETSRLQLCFRSVKKEVQLTWDVNVVQESSVVRKTVKPLMVREKSSRRNA